ncbi:hypothetical protein Dimus_009830 [Dionaea muscipula]
MTATMESDDLSALLTEQRRELSEAKCFQSDLNYAFQLQMEEAITASVSSTASSSSSSFKVPPPDSLINSVSAENNDLIHVVNVFDEEIERWQREQSDLEFCKIERRRNLEELSLRFHDQKFAEEILQIPDHEWQNYGDNYERPFGEGSSSSPSLSETHEHLLSSESFSLYCKGLVVGEEEGTTGGSSRRRKLAAAGVVICGSTNKVVFELSKPLVVEEGGEVSQETAEFEALLEGLDVALSLGLLRVTFCCEKSVYQYITGKSQDVNEGISKLVDHVDLCRKNFIYCTPSLVAEADNSYAFNLARAAILSQRAKPVGYSLGKDLKETCVICLEETGLPLMFTVDDCQHRCCASCVKKHVEVKLNQREVPKCPYAGCGMDLKVNSCQKILGPKLHEVMSQLVKEASIPVTEKVYCPDPRCSTLMSKREVLDYSNARFDIMQELGSCLCVKCQKPFCISCKVPWHFGMSCHSYRKLKPDPNCDDTKLKSLATTNRWRQCMKCRHMIELAEGCYHISCKCGHEFCYTCGAEWMNKKATCSCRLWDERYIICNRNAGR